jgi:hypothetical protein
LLVRQALYGEGDLHRMKMAPHEEQVFDLGQAASGFCSGRFFAGGGVDPSQGASGLIPLFGQSRVMEEGA